MRFYTSAAAFLISTRASLAFLTAPSFTSKRCDTTNVARYMVTEEEKPKKKKLTSADILARARKAVGAPEEEEEAEPIFEDYLLDDMKKCLLMLEKRVKEGPGALNVNDLTEFEAATSRIVKEMNDKLSEEGKPQPQAVTPKQSPPVTMQNPVSEKEVVDISNDEGPAYQGKGGLGLASGTRNTYIIPGMDEMSPEEYRAALQKSVSDRQSKRKDAAGGLVGNRAALNYLDQLGGSGGAAGNVVESSEPVSSAVVPDQTKSNIPVAPPRAPIDVYDPFASVIPHNPVPSSYEQPTQTEAHELVDKVFQVEKSDVSEVVDISNDEAPAYQGKGGLGLASGTRNTYIIPGMDEMSPEEYRAALQKSVSDRQRRRKDATGGVVGNRAALNYLDQLGSGGGASDGQ